MKFLGMDFQWTVNLIVCIVILPTLAFWTWQLKRAIIGKKKAEDKADEVVINGVEERLTELEETKQDKANCVTEALRVSNLEQRIAGIHQEIKDDLTRGDRNFQAINCELTKQGKQLAQLIVAVEFVKDAVKKVV